MVLMFAWCSCLHGAHVCMLQVLVFNCDGEFDFKSVGRIFMGLVKCGAWGCFDEFNRLEEDVLSAVSQQIQMIQVCRLSVCCQSADTTDTGVQTGEGAHDKTNLLALLQPAGCQCT